MTDRMLTSRGCTAALQWARDRRAKRQTDRKETDKQVNRCVRRWWIGHQSMEVSIERSTVVVSGNRIKWKTSKGHLAACRITAFTGKQSKHILSFVRACVHLHMWVIKASPTLSSCPEAGELTGRSKGGTCKGQRAGHSREIRGVARQPNKQHNPYVPLFSFSSHLCTSSSWQGWVIWRN